MDELLKQKYELEEKLAFINAKIATNKFTLPSNLELISYKNIDHYDDISENNVELIWKYNDNIININIATNMHEEVVWMMRSI